MYVLEHLCSYNLSLLIVEELIHGTTVHDGDDGIDALLIMTCSSEIK